MLEHEVRKARDFFSHYGDQILQDEKCLRALKVYRAAISRTWETMKGIGIMKACSECSHKWEGGCCFAGVEHWYGHILFLVNILLGAPLPESRLVRNGCFFVGPTGCLLPARHSFCINYLCDSIKCLLCKTERYELNTMAGMEILSGIQCEETIMKWTAQNAIPGEGLKISL